MIRGLVELLDRLDDQLSGCTVLNACPLDVGIFVCFVPYFAYPT